MIEPENFVPTRAAGLQRLADFVPRAGRQYAAGRNADPGPGNRQDVSLLSPWLRHRLITEHEVVAAVLARHSITAAEKFVQEVLWRTYWKGWLEQRPEAWHRFVAERDQVRAGFRGTADLARAEAGATGIDGFDDWARELVATGYLHNHARMWFASIWIFTLRLPWTLGADFFLRHLIDADPASNTLSWRWVAGLQTVGKTYLARADNIARYTGGRFSPLGLATEAPPLHEEPLPAARPLPELIALDPRRPVLLLVTPEDLHPESIIPTGIVQSALVIGERPGAGPLAHAFVAGAAIDAGNRVAAHFACPAVIAPNLNADVLVAAAAAAGTDRIVTAAAPVGPIADRLAELAPALADAGVTLATVRRPWDARFWPHARKGFFTLKEKIPAVLAAEGL
jgi:deoxyribodipyrimidine photo-lyase